ncbi:hypothetical protein [Wenyingzhuangia sp. 2_MG-2023]|uniref:hypothetical protein n=1 Tax=Wenyingzhuangia sp. 2_MG-2023 TaxID=3062639 RepID=UPI0026E1813A|nr:hypothetical protein [Wenyingzhuangia sp. 2_MG-2023]MDO6738812.1 hypothetical protein [Wenyingzhuangia sp. 2_MG-2023]
MKNNVRKLISIVTMLTLFNSCDEDAFTENQNESAYKAPSNLTYSEVMNAREYSFIKSGTPIVNTNNLIPTYEIVSGRTADGTVLDASYMDAITIENPIENTAILSPEDYFINEAGDTIKSYTSLDYKNAGIITIADENNFGIGDYYFDIKVTTSRNEATFTNTFKDVFHLNIGPSLVTNLLYSPIAQNLVLGTDNTTSKPYLITGNPDVRFALKTETDKLKIDEQTGIISLLNTYSSTENDTIYPMVEITSNISEETTTFQGDSFLMLVASNTPVTLPKKTNYFFYPTLEAENKTFGYAIDVINAGSVTNGWVQSNPSPLAAEERPEGIANKSIFVNPSAGDWLAHESDMIVNTQDLTQYQLGYSLSTIFYTKNQYVEYMPDGSTPTNLEIYISEDYTGDNANATWTQINEQLSCQINSLTDTPFLGTPYPGDQKIGGGDPDNKKDLSKNADNKWVRCELDLNAYKHVKNFTLKFKVKSNYTGSLKGVGSARPGRYYISDVYFKASEE